MRLSDVLATFFPLNREQSSIDRRQPSTSRAQARSLIDAYVRAVPRNHVFDHKMSDYAEARAILRAGPEIQTALFMEGWLGCLPLLAKFRIRRSSSSNDQDYALIHLT